MPFQPCIEELETEPKTERHPGSKVSGICQNVKIISKHVQMLAIIGVYEMLKLSDSYVVLSSVIFNPLIIYVLIPIQYIFITSLPNKTKGSKDYILR